LNTGTKQQVSWLSQQDGLLVMDLNSDGKINNGTELFGNNTLLADGSLASTGWDALADLDSNRDGVIDSKDRDFDKLRVWVDADTDGDTDGGELKTLAEVGVVSIDLGHDNSVSYQNGNALQGFSKFTTADGQTRDIVDVWFQTQALQEDVVPSELEGQKTQLEEAAALQNKPYELSDEDLATLDLALKQLSVAQVDQESDLSANVATLSLADVLKMPEVKDMHQLILTGETTDKVVLTEADWTDTGNVVKQDGQSHAFYSSANDATAQLLIDQQMLQTHLNS
jgi:hypothetical protein